VAGGGGRFLILHLPRLRHLAVFDVNHARVTRYLPLTSDQPLIAAGMTKLIMASRKNHIVERWSLLTFEREVRVKLPLEDPLAGIGMGYGADGPLVLQTTPEPKDANVEMAPRASGENYFFDIRTMRLLEGRATHRRQGVTVYRASDAQFRGSVDGRTFAVFGSGTIRQNYLLTIGPSGATLDLAGGGGRIVPGPDGKHLFGPDVFTHERAVGGGVVGNPTWCVPAWQGPYYLAVPTWSLDTPKPPPGQVEVRVLGEHRPLQKLPHVETAVRSVFTHDRESLSIDEQYHLIPAGQLLVTIPSTMDRLVLHRWSLDAALAQASDYLFIDSTPPAHAVRGQPFAYAVQVKAKKGVARYQLERGPQGMTVSPTGIINWNVPADHALGPVDVMLAAQDRTGQEILQRFNVNVVKELPPETGPRPPVVVQDEPAAELAPALEPKLPVPPAPDPMALRAPRLATSPLNHAFAVPFDRLVVGGGGRFLLLNLPSKRKIALFDVNEAKTVHHFPVAGDNVLYAASLEKLVLIFPETRMVQRWDLRTREREATATLDGNAKIFTVLMGSGSYGPLVVCTGAGTHLLDLQTLKARKVHLSGRGHLMDLAAYGTVSADGSVLAPFSVAPPSGLQLIHVGPAEIKGYYEHIPTGAQAIPGEDGKFVYTGRGVFTNLGKASCLNTRVGEKTAHWCVPAVEGDYFLSVAIGAAPGKGPPPRELCVHRGGEERTLATITDIPLPKNLNPIRGLSERERIKIAPYQRLLFIPTAKLIVAVPETNDCLVLHRFDVDQAIGKSGIDHLCATSRAPTRAVRGEDYVYPITVRSNRGPITYRLESGPKGMSITRSGVIVWKVPADLTVPAARVLVTIADGSGQSTLHAFQLRLADANAQRRLDGGPR
jgi:hypothetical protein